MVLADLKQKGNSFVFTIIPSISNIMTDSVIKGLKANILSGGHVGVMSVNVGVVGVKKF